MVQILRVYAASVILYGDLNNRRKRPPPDTDHVAFFCMVKGVLYKVVTMPPVAAQMMMKAVDFLLLVPYPSDLLYPYSGDTSTLQSTL